MSKARTGRGLVVLVALLLGLSLVAPAAALPTESDTATGDSFGGDLTDSSSINKTSDSGGGSGTHSDSDSDSGSTGGESLSGSGTHSDSDSDSGSTGGESLSGSGSGLESDPDSDSIDDLTRLESTTGVIPIEERFSVFPIGSTDGVSALDGEVVSEADLVDVNTVASPADTSYELELVDLASTGDAVFELTATGPTTDSLAATVATVSDTVADSRDRFVTGRSATFDAAGDTARIGSTEPVGVGDGVAAVDAGQGEAGDGSGDSGAARNAIGTRFPISGDDLPGDPVGVGAIVGLAGAAAAVAARQHSLFSGLGGGFATTARTTVGARGSRYLDRLVRMLAPFRYSRYDDSDPLEHDAREAMFEVVEDSPGTYLSEIADRADIPLSTARHHIRVLEREDLVSGAKVRGKRRFYPAHTEGVELAAAMNDDSTAAVIDALARLGAASVSDLADELGKDPSTVTHHVQRLEEDDVVVRERDGRAVMNKLTAAARTMLEPDGAPAERPVAGEAMASD